MNDKITRTSAVFLELLGGASNIRAVTHCVTRLRLTLACTSEVDETGLRAHPAVLGLVDSDTFQVIVGPATVAPLAQALASMLNLRDCP